MRRRDLIVGFVGTAAWPLAARAQQGERVRRIGVLSSSTMHDPASHARLAAFRQELEQLGWTQDRNVQIEYRWAAGDPTTFADMWRTGCASAGRDPGSWQCGRRVVAAGDQIVPIVFTDVADPVGLASSIAWRGRAATSRASCCSSTA